MTVIVVAATPRCGLNALLEALRYVHPGAEEHGNHFPHNGNTIFGLNDPMHMQKPENVVWIHLQRSDRVAQAISWNIAAQTGQFRPNQPQNGPKPVYSRKNIRIGLTSIENKEKVWEQLLHTEKVLQLVYETDIAPNPAIGAQKVLKHAQIVGKPQKPVFRRQNGDLKTVWRHNWDNPDQSVPTSSP